MRALCNRWILVACLSGATLVGSVADVSAQPDVRDNRRRPRFDDAPRQAPPPPRVERVGRRRGFVWVSGHWDWQNGQWTWINGRWERARTAKKFRAPRWEQRGGIYVRIDAEWLDAAPPPLREENVRPRPGFVFVRGHWEWDDFEWVWKPGRWERERRGKRWREDRWERRGDEWVMINGGWEDGPAVVVSAYPTSPPPPTRAERIGTRAGFIWVRGNWEWRDGKWAWVDGRWERQRSGQSWRDGRWEDRGGRYEWVAGGWDALPDYPTQAPPPAPRDVIPSYGPDQVYIPGNYIWRNGRYEWKSGYLDRARGGFRFEPGSWSLRGDRYVWTDGRWVEDYPTQAPPPPRVERAGNRPGQIWIAGHWQWRGGQWDWVAGRWEAERDHEEFVAGRWERRGNRYEWIEPRWQPFAAFPRQPPPARPHETVQTRAGWTWRHGHYRWVRGQYVWEPGTLVQGRQGERHIAAEWVRRGDRYELVSDRWERIPTTSGYNGPRGAPPPPRDERYDARPGFVWAKGHWRWRDGQYEWLPGHWERERAYKRWVDARWEQRGDEWFFIEGRWE
jgi:hypothetical protein